MTILDYDLKFQNQLKSIYAEESVTQGIEMSFFYSVAQLDADGNPSTIEDQFDSYDDAVEDANARSLEGRVWGVWEYLEEEGDLDGKSGVLCAITVAGDTFECVESEVDDFDDDYENE